MKGTKTTLATQRKAFAPAKAESIVSHDSESKEPIPAPLTPVPALSDMIGLLTVTKKEMKCPDTGEVVVKFDAPTLSMFQALLGPRKYEFILSRVASISSGTGSLSIATSTDLTQYSEGSALQALFAECKLVRGESTIVSAGVGGQPSFSMMYGFDPTPGSAGTTPTGTSIGRLRDALLLSTNMLSGPMAPRLIWTCPGRIWGSTVAEGTGSSSDLIVRGLIGSIQAKDVSGTPGNNNPYFAHWWRIKAAFRNRT